MMSILDFFRRWKSADKSAIKPYHVPIRAAMRMLSGAKHDRLSADWVTYPVTAESIIRRHQRILVARSREQTANNDYARAFVRMARQNIVGPKGILLQAQSRDEKGNLDTLANQAIEAAWERWGRRDNCDIAGRQSWRSIQASAVQSAVRDGEFMIRKIFGRDAGPLGFALQVIDPQRCGPAFDRNDLPDGRFIRAGIEYNQYGRPVAYHFTIVKESEGYYNYTSSGSNYYRIAADVSIHAPTRGATVAE